MIETLAATAAGLGAAVFCGFHSMLPKSQLYGRNFNGLPAGARQLALTYDDGPNERSTGAMLDMLARCDVRATFFMLGARVEKRPELARRVVEAGHAVGNHTYDHPNLIFASPAETRRQIERTQQIIFDATGARPTLFRPGFGARRPDTLRTARSLGLEPVLWRADGDDWTEISPAEIARRMRRELTGGDVMLLHDGGHLADGVDRSRSVEATGILIAQLRGEGYEFVTAPQMMAQTKMARDVA